MKKIILKIDGMTCSACSSGLEKYLNKQKGIKSANVNLVLSMATIEYEDIKRKDLDKYIKDAGFESLGEFKGIDEKEMDHKDKNHLILFGLLLIFMMYLSMGHMLHLPNIPYINKTNPILLGTVFLIITLFFFYYGKDILKSGFKNLIHGMPNMDTLVLASVTFSFLYSVYGYIAIGLGNVSALEHLYFESTCMVIYFIKLGRYIENKSKEKTKDALKKLVQITPQKAIIKKDEEEKEISIDEVQKDDVLICRAGDKIAVDGEVVTGKTYVDESFITGESTPVLKETKSKVIAGSICFDGYIEYKAEKIGKESTISEIVKLVIEATNTKSKIQKLADKISGYFVPIIFILSLLTLIINLLVGMSFEISLTHMVTVLVVACPCALGLAVPLVNVVSSGLCAEKGLFLKNSSILEQVRHIDTIVFDKTGTLTYGKISLFKTYNYSDYKEEELLNIVANIEKNSSHPISNAFKIKYALEVTDFETKNGYGLTAKVNGKKYNLGNEKFLTKLKIKNTHQQDYEDLVQNGCSIIFVIEEEKVIGLIGVKDIVRDSVKKTIKEMKDKHLEVIMLTGDNETTAGIIAKELGIQKVIANVIPKKKEEEIKNLLNQGKRVIMVGDGINDAPALITATIGVSVNDGTDIAMDSADVILMNNNMQNILDLIEIGKSSYRIIKQNLFWAFFYNLCMIPIAMGLLSPLGINMTPMFGSLAMVLSSLTVVLNALRFGRYKKWKRN